MHSAGRVDPARDVAHVDPARDVVRVVLVALVARLLLFAAIAPWKPEVLETRILRLDARLYADQSEEVLHGHLLSPGSMKAPGYPVFLAAVRVFAGGRLFAALVVQCVAGAAIAGIVVVLGRRFFGETAALIGGYLVALDPASVLIANCLLSDIPFALLLALGVWTMLRAFHNPGVRWPLASGILFALATLARPIGVFLPFLAVPFLVLIDRRGGRSLAAQAARLAAFLAPWIAGVVLWIARGANLDAFKDAARLFDWYLITIRHTTLAKQVAGIAALLFESGSSLFAELLGIDSTKVVILSDNVEGGWGGALRRAFLERNAAQLAFLVASLAVLVVTYVGIAAAVLDGALRRARDRAGLVYVIVTALVLLAVSSLWGTMRYRVPVMPFLALVSGVGWAVLASQLAARRKAL